MFPKLRQSESSATSSSKVSLPKGVSLLSTVCTLSDHLEGGSQCSWQLLKTSTRNCSLLQHASTCFNLLIRISVFRYFPKEWRSQFHGEVVWSPVGVLPLEGPRDSLAQPAIRSTRITWVDEVIACHNACHNASCERQGFGDVSHVDIWYISLLSLKCVCALHLPLWLHLAKLQPKLCR